MLKLTMTFNELKNIKIKNSGGIFKFENYSDTKIFVEDTVQTSIRPRQGKPTYYSKNGDMFSLCCVILSIILVYALILLPVAVSPYFFNFASLVYLVISSVTTFYYIYLCFKLFKTKNVKRSNIIARKVFVYSIFYLFLLFLTILFDNLIITL